MKLSENPPLVSIICLTYNHAPFIKDCLEGFLKQKTSYPFEVIIHDDASTDGTSEVIKEYHAEYPEIFKPILQSENQYSQHKNFSLIIQNCLDKCLGKYIAFCEGDDYWTDEGKVEQQTLFLEENPEYGMIYAKTRYYYHHLQYFRHNTFGGPNVSLKDLITLPYCIPTATILIRTTLLKHIFNTIVHSNRWAMSDYPISLGAALYSKIFFYDKEVAVYRVISDSACHFSRFEDEVKFINSSYEVKKYFIAKGQLDDVNLKDFYFKDLWRRAFSSNNYPYAQKYAKQINASNLYDRLAKIITSNRLIFNLAVNMRKIKKLFMKNYAILFKKN